ncbi:MAG TPA: RIP metalloprotease RseP [Longimicrobiales bacterium]
MLITLLATIIVLGVLIFVHELGHFVTAKLVDIEVPRFSIGFGPKVFGFRRGETEYVISLLPLGGYVKMAGMEEMERIEGGKSHEDEPVGSTVVTDAGLVGQEHRRPGPREFEAKSLPARALVISAGVLMNFLFAFLVFALSAFVWGVPEVPEARIGGVTEEALPPGAEALADVPRGARVVAVGGEPVGDWAEFQRRLADLPPGPVPIEFEGAPSITIRIPAADSARASLIAALDPVIPLDPVIGTVVAGSPAEQAGLQPGDRIRAVAGQPVATWQDLVAAIEARPGQPTEVEVEREGRVFSVTLTPEARKLASGREYGRIGVGSAGDPSRALPRERPGPIGALAQGAKRTWEVTALTVGFLADLITGDVSPRNLGGPILIGQLSGRVARAGIEAFLNFMALFSVNLAVLNLLPIPVLDGGHLLFLGVEAVRGRALSLEQRVRLTQVGFIIVVAIMIWAFANDVLRLFGL